MFFTSLQFSLTFVWLTSMHRRHSTYSQLWVALQCLNVERPDTLLNAHHSWQTSPRLVPPTGVSFSLRGHDFRLRRVVKARSLVFVCYVMSYLCIFCDLQIPLPEPIFGSCVDNFILIDIISL